MTAPTAEALGRLFSRDELQYLAFKYGFQGVLGAHEAKPRFAEAVCLLFSSGRLCAPSGGSALASDSGGGGGGESSCGSAAASCQPESSPYFCLEEDITPSAPARHQQQNDDVDLSEEEYGAGEEREGRRGLPAAAAARPAAGAAAAPGRGGRGHRGYVIEEVPQRLAQEAWEEARLVAILPPVVRELFRGAPESERRGRALTLMREGGGLEAMEAAAAAAAARAPAAVASSGAPGRRQAAPPLARTTASVGVQWSPRPVPLEAVEAWEGSPFY
jgi:hypothetical protein